jgi:hypothetical protein
MNLIDAYVTQVLSDPYEKYGKWFLEVEYTSWGRPGRTKLMLSSKREALAVFPGYRFQT